MLPKQGIPSSYFHLILRLSLAHSFHKALICYQSDRKMTKSYIPCMITYKNLHLQMAVNQKQADGSLFPCCPTTQNCNFIVVLTINSTMSQLQSIPSTDLTVYTDTLLSILLSMRYHNSSDSMCRTKTFLQ